MAELDEKATPPAAEAPAPEPRKGKNTRRNGGFPQDDVPSAAVAHTNPGRLDDALEHAKLCARIAADNRAKDILLLDLRGATPLVDFFMIATATSRRLGNAISIEIDQEMKKIGELKLGIEGSEEGRWTLIDYGDFVVHVFSEEARAYYALEEIWGDAEKIDWHDPDRVRPKDRPTQAETPVSDDLPDDDLGDLDDLDENN